MKSAKKIICFIIAVIIIAGIIICKTKGFNISLTYSARQQINLSSSNEIDEKKVAEISKSILTDRRVKVKKLERFGNAVQIIAETISEEEKQSLISKINEECGTNISNDDTKIVQVPNTRIRDVIKPYIIPSAITFLAVLLYFIIMYHKIGLIKILLNGILVPILAELLYYSLIAITRIQFGIVTNSIAVGIYVITIGILTIRFQKEKNENKEKKEND